MFKNIALVVSTCEKNKYLLNNFFKLLKINFPEYKGTVKLTINSTYFYEGYNIQTISKPLKDDSFSTALIESLKETDEKYILFMLEDLYLLRKVDINLINAAIDVLDKDKNVDFVQLNEQSFINQSLHSKKVYNEFFLLKNNRCPYSATSYFGIWRKSFLLKILRKRESAWEFEYYGSYRVNRIKHKCLTVRTKYKLGSRLFPDGGILHRGKIINNYSKIYKKFNLDFFNSKCVTDEEKHDRKSPFTPRLNFIWKYYNHFYPKLTLYFPFFKKINTNQLHLPYYILKEADFDNLEIKKYKKFIPTIGIICIMTADQILKWKKFYKSAEKYFLSKYKKIYYLFTDIDIDVPDNVKLIYQKNLEYLKNDMIKYKMILEHRKSFEFCKYLFIFGSNITIKRKIYSNILPINKCQIVFTLNPEISVSCKDISEFRTNTKSNYVFSDLSSFSFLSGFVGGHTESLVLMCKSILNRIKVDLKNDVISNKGHSVHANGKIYKNTF